MPRSVQTANAPDTVPVAGLRFDRAPVTNARYAEFVRATGHRPPAFWEGGGCPPSLREHPVVGVDYFDAVAFARWAGGCLPTELEWALAPGLEEPRAYPWGDAFESRRCNTIRSGRKSTTPVGSYPAAPSGCVDLCGNVWEFTCSGGGDGSVLVKGGSWFDYPAHARIDSSFRAPIDATSATVGFRLCYGRPERHPGFVAAADVERAVRERCRGGRAEVERQPPAANPPGLPDPPPLQSDAIHAALSQLDRGDPPLPISPVPARSRALSRGVASLARMQRLLVQRRGVLLAVAAGSILLVATTLGAAMIDEAPIRTPAQRLPAAEADRAARPVSPSVKRTPRVIIRRTHAGDQPSRAELERAAAAETDPAKRRSLRYRIATIDEARNGAGEPMALTVLPTRDLVYVCARMGADERACIAMLRKLGWAEGLSLTVVYGGTKDFGAWFDQHRAALGRVYAVPDADRRFRDKHALTAGTAVLGLHTDGRAAFILSGRPNLASIAPELAKLR